VSNRVVEIYNMLYLSLYKRTSVAYTKPLYGLHKVHTLRVRHFIELISIQSRLITPQKNIDRVVHSQNNQNDYLSFIK